MNFKSLLTKVILENMEKIDFLIDTYAKPKVKEDGKKKPAKLTIKELAELISADPTSNLNEVDIETATAAQLKKAKAGKYTPWIIKSYLDLNQQTEIPFGQSGYDREVKELKSRFMEDLYKITNDLTKFIRFKNRIPEEDRKRAFTKGFTPNDLYQLVKDFSLEKTKASKEEKQEASTTYQHPGADIIFRGKDWTVARISDKGALGKDAACFYGGYYLETAKGETRWCTSSPGLNWFDRYIKDGPLYVVIPNQWSGKRGEKSGLPADRYQFHFPSNQFMDPEDRSVNLVQLLNGKMSELKEVFKPEFAKGLTTNDTKLAIDNFEHGVVGKFIALYGLDDLIKNLPETLTEFQIQNKNNNQEINITIPKDIAKFKNLKMILLENCISEIPDEICQLKELKFLALTNNPKLTSIPECLATLPHLYFLNLKGSPNVKVPKFVQERGEEMHGMGMWDLAQANKK